MQSNTDAGTLFRTSIALQHALTSVNKTIVQQYLSDSAQMAYKESNGNYTLHNAFLNKQEEMVDLFLEAIHSRSTYDNYSNSFGLTYLHIACTRKNEKVIQGFLDAGADIEATIDSKSTNWAGFNALHFAASYQSLPALKLLLKAGMNPKSKTTEGKTAVELIYENLGDSLIMVDLLENKKNLKGRPFTNFLLTCLNEDEKLVQKFIDYGAAKIDYLTSHELSIALLSTPLHFAVATNNRKKVELLLQNGAKVECINSRRMTPLHLALYQMSIDLLKCLRGNFDEKIADLLYEAVKDKMSFRQDDNGLSFFHAAIAMKDLSTVKKYVTQSHADVNKPLLNNCGRISEYTPLHMAVEFRSLEVAEFLIDCGADVNAISQKCGTPWHLAFDKGYYNFIELFLMNGAKIDMMSPTQETILHLILQFVDRLHLGIDPVRLQLSTKFNDEAMLNFMEQAVELGVDVNAKKENGDTVLHYFGDTATDKWTPYYQALLDHGADINLRNHMGHLPNNDFFLPYWLEQWPCQAVSIFYHHVQKLKALGLKVDPDNEKICELIIKKGKYIGDGELNCREQQRLEEIAKLKNIKITNNISLYNLIKLDSKHTTFYSERVVNNFKSIAKDFELKREFPSYGYLIKLKYREAVGCNGNITKKRFHSKVDEEIANNRQHLE